MTHRDQILTFPFPYLQALISQKNSIVFMAHEQNIMVELLCGYKNIFPRSSNCILDIIS